MKKLVYILPLLFLIACQSSKVERVEASYPDNSKKIVSVYQIENGEENLLEEKHFYQNGKLKMKGKFLNGKREGEWKSYFANDQIQSTGTFGNGVRTGEVKIYHPNGNLMIEGFYKEGKEFGHWKFYTKAGKLAREKDF